MLRYRCSFGYCRISVVPLKAFLSIPCKIYLQHLIDFELRGSKLLFDVNRYPFIWTGYTNKSDLENKLR